MEIARRPFPAVAGPAKPSGLPAGQDRQPLWLARLGQAAQEGLRTREALEGPQPEALPPSVTPPAVPFSDPDPFRELRFASSLAASAAAPIEAAAAELASRQSAPAAKYAD